MDRILDIQKRIAEIENLFTPPNKKINYPKIKDEKENAFKKALNEIRAAKRIDTGRTELNINGFPLIPQIPEENFPAVTHSGYTNPCPAGKISPYSGDDGLDIHAPVGTPVYAAKDGVIVYNDPAGHSAWEGPGNDTGAIRIKHSDGTETWYAHLSGRDESLKPGMTVKAGQEIGQVGTANNVPHLHMSIFYSSGGDEGGFMDPFEMAHMFQNENEGVYAKTENTNNINEINSTPALPELVELSGLKDIQQLVSMNYMMNMNNQIGQAMPAIDEYE